jgi:hypothetical protein
MPLAELQAIAERLAALARSGDTARLDMAIDALVSLPLSPLRLAYVSMWAYALLADNLNDSVALQRAFGRACEREP